MWAETIAAIPARDEASRYRANSESRGRELWSM
jgi:hypothetical protein